MNILCHRGFWDVPEERNSPQAMRRAFDAGLGVETDVRDCDGTLVISHDMPRRLSNRPLFSFDDFLALYTSGGSRPTLALNIKADGLAAPIKAALTKHGITEYFVFDMSVPDTQAYLGVGLNVFTRWSEFETGSKLDNSATGIWLDAFEDPFVSPQSILEVVRGGKRVAIVSPELHNKLHLDAWRAWHCILTELPSGDLERVSLCTDLPNDAKRFFAV